MNTQPQKCNVCHEEIQDVSFDVWLFETRYDERHEVISTGEEVISSAFGSTYYVIGECCKARLVSAWNGLLVTLGG